MTDRIHSCRQSPNGRHRFTVSPLLCDYCARTATYLTDMGWNAPANDPDWQDEEADVNDAKPGPSKETLKAFTKEEDERMAALVYTRMAAYPRCAVCGSYDLATGGWCITCRYGDSPKH